MKEQNFISAVVYARNNERNIKGFLTSLIDVLMDNFEKMEVIVVDDFSTDETLQEIKSVEKETTENVMVTIVKLSYYQGLEIAMSAGVDLAIGDFVYEFDSVISDYDSQELINAYKLAIEGHDIVSVCPNTKERLSSKIFYWLFRKYSRNNLRLKTERFRIISRRGINRINMLTGTIPYRKAIYYDCGLNTTTLEYSPKEGQVVSGDNGRERMELAVNSLLLFTDIGARIASYMAIIMVFASIAMGGYALIVYLFFETVVSGWTTTILFTSLAFTFFFALLYIMIRYLTLILNLQRYKMNYVYENIERIKIN